MAKRLRVARTVPALRRAVGQWREPPASGSRWCRPWARCMPDMLRWCAPRRGARRASSYRSSSIPRNSRRTRTFASYPRTFDSDLAALARIAGRPGLGAVDRGDVSAGVCNAHRAGGPATAGLEDKFRPHFFAGVTTVVGKLLIQCAPDFAMFGEKDYQQLKVVTRMAKDLDLPAEDRCGVPTVREKDGLALSSRNAYLSASERAAAPTLHRVLKDCAGRIASGESLARVLDEAAPRSSARASCSTISKRATPRRSADRRQRRCPRPPARGRAHRQGAADRQPGGMRPRHVIFSPSMDP